MIHFPFDSVEGFLSEQDREYLGELSDLSASRQSGELKFFEIGSYKGLSALCILDAVSTRVNLICYDWFEPDKYLEFTTNLLAAGYTGDRVTCVPGDFKLAKIPDGEMYAFGFVDHSHTLSDTKAAYDMFWPRMLKGGVLAFHDRGHPSWPEATEFLESLPHKRVLDTNIIAFLKE